jgi:hypothetical protein
MRKKNGVADRSETFKLREDRSMQLESNTQRVLLTLLSAPLHFGEHIITMRAEPLNLRQSASYVGTLVTT